MEDQLAPPQPNKDAEHPAESMTNASSTNSSPLTIAVVSGFAAALISLAGNYWITLNQVEKPKIELEQKKTLLEAHKQILSLSPKVETSCTAQPWNKFALRVVCSSKNTGVYPVVTKIDSVEIIIDSDPSRNKIPPGDKYKDFYPNNKRQFLNPAGTPPGSLEVFLTFPQEKYPDGINFEAIHANVNFKYETSNAASSQLAKTFPEQADLIDDVKSLPTESIPATFSN